MEVIENGIISLKKANRHCNIPITSLSNHLYVKIRFKKSKLEGMLIVKEDQSMVAWDFSMQGVGLSISLQHLKMKVAKLTQIRLTPFFTAIPRTFWYEFKKRHP
jgi:hypothetical protein